MKRLENGTQAKKLLEHFESVPKGLEKFQDFEPFFSVSVYIIESPSGGHGAIKNQTRNEFLSE